MKYIDESWYQKPEGVPVHESAGGVVARIENGRAYVALIHEIGMVSLDNLPDMFWPEQKQLIEENRKKILQSLKPYITQ